MLLTKSFTSITFNEFNKYLKNTMEGIADRLNIKPIWDKLQHFFTNRVLVPGTIGINKLISRGMNRVKNINQQLPVPSVLSKLFDRFNPFSKSQYKPGQTVEQAEQNQQTGPEPNKQSKHKLAFIVMKDPETKYGHAGLGLIKHDEHYDHENKRSITRKRLISRFGFWNTSQVQLEHFLEPRANRTFSIKELDVSEQQLKIFFDEVNKDRHKRESIDAAKYPFGNEVHRDNTELTYVQHDNEVHRDNNELRYNQDDNKPQSNPGGPIYNRYFFNCKDYCIDLLRRAGISDKVVQNLQPEEPLLSIPMQTPDLTTYHLVKEQTADNSEVMRLESDLTKEQAKTELNNYINKKQRNYDELNKTYNNTDKSLFSKTLFFSNKHNLSELQNKIQQAQTLKNAIEGNTSLPCQQEKDLQQSELSEFYQECIKNNVVAPAITSPVFSSSA